MCMEDIRIGRKTASHSRTLVVSATTVTTLVPLDPMRIGLVIGLPGTTLANIGPEGVTPSATVGIGVNANIGPFVATLETFGREVTKPWQIYWTAGGTVTITEITLEKE